MSRTVQNHEHKWEGYLEATVLVGIAVLYVLVLLRDWARFVSW